MAVITVSREYGTHGEQIAQQVAEGLGYSYFDKEILTDVARVANTTEEKISSYDEKDEHGMRCFLTKLFMPDYPGFVHYPYYPGIAVGWPRDLTETKPALDTDKAYRQNVSAVLRSTDDVSQIIVG